MIVLSKIKKLIDIFNSEGMTGVTNKIKSKAIKIKGFAKESLDLNIKIRID